VLRLRPLAVLLSLALALCLLGLWSARSQTGALRRVTNTTRDGVSVNPSLSGDGRHISFESTKDLAGAGGNGFHALRADLAPDPATFIQMGVTRAPAPGISQDGSSIAFASKDDPLGTNPDGNSEIFLFNGTLRQITNTTPSSPQERTRQGNFQPSLTDDGRFIAFSSNRNLANQNADGNLEIFIFDTSSSAFTQLTNTTGPVGATDAKISGDGTRVAYIFDIHTTPSTQRELVLQDRVTRLTRVLAGDVTNLAFTYGRAISDDGLRVVYSGDTAPNSSQVFLFDGRTTNATRQITTLGVRETEVPLHPTISGDGRRIAFATRRPMPVVDTDSDNSIDLFTYDIPTGQFARVTDAPSVADGFDGSNRAAEVVSSLSDDGLTIAFNFPRSLIDDVETEFDNNSEIYVTGTAVRPSTGPLTVLNGASFGHEPETTEAVAPDSIAVARGGALSFTTERSQRQADGTFPRTVGGTTVTVNGRSAQIFYVSPEQVNFHVPAETELGIAEVIVTNIEGFQSRGTIQVLRAAPGIFTISGDGLGEGMILNADTLQPGPFDPSSGQLRLVIFATGVRRASQVTATAGGRALTVESVMETPTMPGMDEVRVLVPADLRGAGTVELVIRADTRDSNPVTVSFSGDACRDIVINEVLADPPDGIAGDANHDLTRSGTDDEFVELVNTTNINLDISGYQLLTRSSTASTDTVRHTFAPGTIFPARSAIVIFGGGNPTVNNPAFGGAQIFKASSGGLALNNAGGVVTLRQPSQAIANIFFYGGSTGLNGDTNQSLTRAPDAGVTNVCGNFAPHTTAPGSNGQPFSPGTQINGLPFARGLGQLTSVTISPPSASVIVGRTTQFTAQARDQFNRPITNVSITFISDNKTVATVDGVTIDPTTGIATATVTGRSEGTAHITAQATDGTTTVNSTPATLTVNPLPAVVTRVEVSPPNATINRGQTQQFTATAFDQNNQPIANATFTWTSSDTNVATIDQNGLATGVGLGAVTITATTPDATGAMVSGTATLNVQVPLVINEINADVAADNVSTPAIEGDANRDGVRDSDDDEFIELFNNSNAAVDISGVIIADGTSNRFTIPANTTLASGRALIIFGGGTPPASDPAFGGALVLAISGSGTLSLNDGGDTVNVKLNFGGTDHSIASVTYGGTGNPPAPSDQSLTRSPDTEVGTTGGAFVQHTSATNAAGRTFSPGTRTDGTPFGSPAITRIEVLPASAAIDIGATQQFTARAFSNAFGPEIEVQNVSFIWDSSDTSKATVAPTTGASTTARGVAPGSITIRARAGGQQGTAALTVNSAPPVLTSVTISPLSATINAGQTQQFTGQALDQFGQPIGGVTVTFVSNNTTVATVDSVSPTSATGSATATVTGHTNGSAEIRATATNGTTTVTSTPATLTVASVANPGDVVISEFRTRGPNGANDEFIELYNRTTAPIDISGYKIFRSNNAGATNLTATITSGVILGPGCHYLLTNSNSGGPYSGSVAGDQTYGTGITADGGIALTIPGGTATTGIIDQVGLSAGSAYKEGTPLAPFAGDAEQSYERKPGGAFGNGTDTDNNASDFLLNAASSNPQNLSSGCLDVTTADLGITKTDSPDPVTTGFNVTYTITVTNNGAGTAQAVVVADDLPASVSFVSCSSTGSGVCGGTGNNRTITFSSLPGGAIETITLVATVNGAGGTTITNTATVSSTTPDPNTGNNSATATTNVQAPLPFLSINDVTVTEGDSGTKTVDFTVTLSAASTQTVTVGYATSSASPATATAGTDYQSTSGTLTFNPGETAKPVTVTINGDTLVEPDETFFVDLSGATNAIITDAQGQGTITNDDTANLVISQVYGGGNNSGALYQRDFIEIFNRGTTTVDFSVTNYSVQYASAGANFGSSKTDLTSGTIAPGHYFLIQESGGTTNGAPLPAPDATGTINLVATAGKVALVVGTTPLAAAICPGDDGIAPFNPNDGTIADFIGYGSVVCYEGSNPAPAPSNTTADFRRAGGCQDTNDNAADFFVFAPNPRNTASPVNNCSAGAPSLTISDATVTEGNSGTVTATFTVQLSAPANGTDVTFDIATQNNTALSGSDYVAKSLTNQLIPAGQQTYTFTVTVNGDTAIEPDETFFVNVTNVSGATLTDGQGVGTIQNDDLPALSINDVTQNEGNAGTSTFSFTVHLSSPAPANVTFDIATADGTAQDDVPATEDNDYVAKSLTTQTIPAGSQDYTFDVTVNGDTSIEPNETFFVNVTNVTGATLADAQGQGTIQNDDSPSLSINDVTLSEGNTGTKIFQFTVSLSVPAPAGGVTFNIATQDNTATVDDGNPSTISDNDYVGKSLTSQTIPEGSQTYTFDVTVNGDTLVEADETFFVNLSGAVNATISDPQGIGTITNDDTADLVISQVYGGGGNANAPYTNDFVEIFNQGTTTIDFSVTPYSVQYASASASGTFSSSNKTNLTAGKIAPGGYFLVQEASGGAVGVALPTPDATGTIALAATSGKVALVVGIGVLPAFTCPGDDGTSPFNPSDSLIADFVGYGGSAATTGHCYEGNGPAPAPSATTADFRKSGGCLDTDQNGTDFFVAAPVPRNTASPLNDCSGGLRPDITINDRALSESTSPANFTVTLSMTSTQTVTVDYSTANGTATAGADYSAVSGTLTFAPGETTKTINVPITNDTLDEPDETYFVNLSNASNAILLDNQGQGTINDNDNTPTLSINDASVTEGDSGTKTLDFTVTLSTASGQTVTVDYATADNTATAGTDYQAASGTLTFNPGDTTKTVSVIINGDTTVEPNETFFVNLTNPSNATTTDNQGQGTITNDDVTPSISITDVTLNEGNAGTTAFTFTVTLSPSSTQTVTVDYATADGTATAPGDYTAIATTQLSFAPGETSKQVTVQVNGDTDVEGNETFFVNLSTPTNATIADNQGVGTITNDDAAATSADLSVTKTDSPDPVAIGNDITYTITVTNNGPDTAVNAVLSDTVPTNTTFRSITTPAGWTCGTVPAVGGTGSISCTNPGFAAGSSIFTLVVRVNTTATDGTIISNTASVSSSTADSNGLNNSATQTTTVKQPLLVVSQIYPGGGNASASFTNDFIEIFNRGTTTVDFSVTPYSLQYTGASGNFGGTTATVKFDLTSGTIAPGQYFLVQGASGGAVGAALPTPDAISGISMATGGGKVALVLGIAVLPVDDCPGDDNVSPFNPNNSTIVDFVGYGTAATCYEGSGPAPFSTSTNQNARSTIRTSSCTDTNNNAADFTNPTNPTGATPPVPRNKATTPAPCP
jgi:uncharacterized repeat protein (TIGR01451 family)